MCDLNYFRTSSDERFYFFYFSKSIYSWISYKQWWDLFLNLQYLIYSFAIFYRWAFEIDTGCTAVNGNIKVVITKEVADILQLHGSEQRNIRTGSGLMPFSVSYSPAKIELISGRESIRSYNTQSICLDGNKLIIGKKAMTEMGIGIPKNCEAVALYVFSNPDDEYL